MGNFSTIDSLSGNQFKPFSISPDVPFKFDASNLGMGGLDFNRDFRVAGADVDSIANDKLPVVELTDDTKELVRKANLEAVLRAAVEPNMSLRPFSQSTDDIFLKSINFNAHELSASIATDFKSISSKDGTDSEISKSDLQHAFRASLLSNDIDQAAKLYAIMRGFQYVTKLNDDSGWGLDRTISIADVNSLNANALPELSFLGNLNASVALQDETVSNLGLGLFATGVATRNFIGFAGFAASAIIADVVAITMGKMELNKQHVFLSHLYDGERK